MTYFVFSDTTELLITQLTSFIYLQSYL